MSTRLTRQEKRALVAIVAGTVLFFVVPWVVTIAAVASGFEAGVIEP